MSVRQALHADATQVLTLARAFHAGDGHLLPAAGEAALLSLLEPESGNGFVLVAEDNGRLTGYGAICFGFSVEYGGRDAFLDDLYVDPDFRSAGAARTLLNALEAEARARGVRFLHMEVMPGNSIGGWYARRGFADRGSRLMTKSLALRA